MKDFEKDVNDDGKLQQRYQNKKVNALKENLKFLLSYEEYCSHVDN